MFLDDRNFAKNPILHVVTILIISMVFMCLPDEYFTFFKTGKDKNVKIIEQKDDYLAEDSIKPVKDTTKVNLDTLKIVDTTKIISTPAEIKPKTTKNNPQYEQKPQDSLIFSDFSNNLQMHEDIIARLSEAQSRKVRIAVMGDSFIEGDIITMTLRDKLQARFSGGGIGFMPITALSARSRRTINHNFSNDWKRKCIIYKNDFDYTLSGEVFIPDEESWVSYEHPLPDSIANFESAKLLFINKQNSVVNVTINDEPSVEYTLNPSEDLQELVINKPFHKISYTFHSVEGLVVYGAVLDNQNKGISVDNYSIRGNLGLTMNKINQKLSSQLSNFLPYDMIILQYGLNIIEQDREFYGGYYEPMDTVIKHLKKCYPNTPILICGISERSTLIDNEIVTMPGVLNIAKLQQKVAHDNRIMYWNTLEAMRRHGGMKAFIKHKWAARDYMHLSVRGGEILAEELYNSVF